MSGGEQHHGLTRNDLILSMRERVTEKETEKETEKKKESRLHTALSPHPELMNF